MLHAGSLTVAGLARACRCALESRDSPDLPVAPVTCFSFAAAAMAPKRRNSGASDSGKQAQKKQAVNPKTEGGSRLLKARNTEAEVDDAIAYNFKNFTPSELDGKKVQAPNGEMMTLRERLAYDKRRQRDPATYVPMGLYYYQARRREYSVSDTAAEELEALMDAGVACNPALEKAVDKARESKPQRGDFYDIVGEIPAMNLMDSIGTSFFLLEQKPWLGGEQLQLILAGLSCFERCSVPSNFPAVWAIMRKWFDRALCECFERDVDSGIEPGDWWIKYRRDFDENDSRMGQVGE